MAHRTQFHIAIGRKFHRWTIIGTAVEAKQRDGNSHRWIVRFPCRCDCGKEAFVTAKSLLSGGTRSCGCLTGEENGRRSTKHGHTTNRKPDRPYRIWAAMVSRCHGYGGAKNRRNYSGRGISVCQEWRESFSEFLAWSQSNGYADHLQIDRIDPNGNYHPNNCRWVTVKRQTRNKRNSRMIEHEGRRMNLVDWAEEIGIKSSTLRNRIDNGWCVEDALYRPIRFDSRHHAKSAD